jgi:uncharacterized protein (TIGR03085 family)
VTPLAGAERAGLCDLLEQSLPDAPTLCAGWTTYDLAAHLVLRERRPLEALGIAVPVLRNVTARAMRRLQQRHGYAGLVALLRSGPPRWSPMRAPRFAEESNALEFFVHFEDVRRAASGWLPRQLPFAAETALWSQLDRIARVLGRRSPVGLELVRTDTPDARRVKPGEPAVAVRGLPSELVLFCFGRRDVADVAVDGHADAVQRLRAVQLSVQPPTLQRAVRGRHAPDSLP